MLSPKCSLRVREGMVFNINIGLADLSNPHSEDEAGKNYSLFIGDTVLVGEVGNLRPITSDREPENPGPSPVIGNQRTQARHR